MHARETSDRSPGYIFTKRIRSPNGRCYLVPRTFRTRIKITRSFIYSQGPVRALITIVPLNRTITLSRYVDSTYETNGRLGKKRIFVVDDGKRRAKRD